VYEGLKKLEETVKDFNVELLFENDQFVSVLCHAIQIALRTHQKEKLGALRNAVLNAALPSNISDDKQLIFLNWIDEITPSHIQILCLQDAPRKWVNEHHVGTRHFDMAGEVPNIEELKRTLRETCRDLLEFIILDLKSKGLIQRDPVEIFRDGNRDRLDRSHLPQIGRDFMAFITSPIPDEPTAQAPGHVP
jgi:hypothetical protein